MSDFCDSPMSDEFNKQGSIPKGGPGQYNGETVGPFGGYTRTKSPNSVDELTYDKALPGGTKISGEPDQF